MAFAEAEKKLRWIPKSLMLKKLGMPKAKLKPYLAANADVARRGTARIAGRFLTDQMFRTALIKIVALRGDAPTWVYRFSWPSGVFGFAEHCLDVPFFFDCLDSIAIEPLAGPNPPQRLADEVHGGAVAFITTGEPGWPRYTETERKTRVYDAPSTVVADGYASVRPLLAG
jgi:para-nitrobenzyl esterase